MKFSFKNLFRRKRPVSNTDIDMRMFAAAQHNRLTDWPVSYQRINGDLFLQYQTIVLRCRNLAMNNEAVIGLLRNFTRNVVGAHGFTLQSKAEPAELRPRIEALWREYGSRSGGYVTMDERSSARDLDILILRSLLIDGECFIHRVFDPESRFGWRYEVIDSLQIDPFYMDEALPDGYIFMGIEFDSSGREVAFWYRPTICEQYNTGPRERIPADDIIHLFRKEFPAQMRGIPALAGAVMNLKQLDDYRTAELIHAQIGSCVMGVWEYDGTGDDGFAFEQGNDKGEFIREIKPGIFPIAPKGYKAKFLQNPGTSSQFPDFVKSVMRSICNSIGISYNKGSGDYESVNYSSLREASLEDRESYAELQTVMIEGWKDLQFRDFLEYAFFRALIPSNSLFTSVIPHRFYGKRFSWVDPAKEIKAKREEMALMLTSPEAELEARGLDPDEVIEDFVAWKKKLEAVGLGGFWDAAFGMKEPEIAEQNAEENNATSEGESNG